MAAGAITVLCVAGLFLVRPEPVALLDQKVGDVLVGWIGPGQPSGRVSIVEIDEESLQEYGRWPWSREVLARLTNRLFASGAATVVFDMMFPEEDGAPAQTSTGPGTNDAAFAEALAGRPTVIGYTMAFTVAGATTCHLEALPLAIVGPAEHPESFSYHATGAVCSVPAISRAAAGGGFLNASPDSDGKLRRIPVLMEYDRRYYPGLALAALNVYRRAAPMELVTNARGARELRLDRRAIALEGRGLLRLRFRGSGGSFPRVSAAVVLRDRVPDGMLRGQIAVVGAGALGLRNASATPVDNLLPAVELQATAIDNLLEGDSFHRPGEAQSLELVLAVLGGLVACYLLTSARPLRGALIAVCAIAGIWAGCAVTLWATGGLLSPLPISATLACAVPVLALVNYRREKTRADSTEERLAVTREQSRVQLRESENRYQQLVEHINDAIILVDLQGQICFANHRFQELFGWDRTGLRAAHLENHVASEWRAAMREKYDRLFRGESNHEQIEYEGLRPDGARIWIEALITAVRVNQELTGAQAALRDTTDRKRMEAQYLQAQKMESVGRLAGSVAHDFNNLLMVINGYSELLLQELGPDAPSREGVEQIREAGGRAAELTQKLLVFSRKQMVQSKVLDLNNEVTGTQKLVERLIGEDITLITRLSPEPSYVKADPTQMHQVLMNLLVNARDAMPQGGQIVIETRNLDGGEDCAGPHVCLSVTDTGTGMSDEVKRHLFEPFFTTKESGKGTGLGLATIHGITENYGGRIEVTSEMGQGSSFRVYLPRVQSGPALERPAGPAAAGPLGAQTVLVVDDQDAVRHLVCLILRSHGYQVLEAASGPDAVALAERYPATIDLLLTDVVMPRMSGRQLALTLTAARPALQVLYMSGYSGDTVDQHVGPLSEVEYLAKPFTPIELVEKVRVTLEVGPG